MKPEQTLFDKNILLIIGGGIAAYKCLDLIRRLRERGAHVRCVMSEAARNFVTPLSVETLTADTVFTDLWNREDEHDVGHIRLAREADMIVVAPATADLMAKMANGLANDLASTVLLAATGPILAAPAMNPAMWNHPATRRNRVTLEGDGISLVGPNEGEMAESGEAGQGRMAEPMEIVAAVETALDDRPQPLAGRRAIVTSGPTREDIDPVRYISNHSSGKQGHAVAAALARAGAEVILISGPVTIPDPEGTVPVHISTAEEMLDAVNQALPADIAVFVAAVADWRAASTGTEKIKKDGSGKPPALAMVENPDILKETASRSKDRPSLVVGFAAETQNLLANARTKLDRKGADWIIANDVSPENEVFGSDTTHAVLISRDGEEDWGASSKHEVAQRLVERICERFETVTI